MLAIEVPFFFWGWTTSIVDDDFRLSPGAMGGAAALLAVGGLGMATSSPRSDAMTVVLHSVVGIGFVVAALVNVLRGWRQDLVETRRRLRALIVILCGGYSIGIMAVELVLAGRPASTELELLNAVLLAALLNALAYALQRHELATARRLLKLGARPDLPVGSADMPLALAALIEGDAEAVQLLQHFGVDYSKLSYQGVSAREIAKATGHSDLLELGAKAPVL